MGLALNTIVANEQERIVGLLEHCATFCDELIVVDVGSTDQTMRRALDFGATVVKGPVSLVPEVARPLAAAHTRGDFILILDADETVAPFAVTALQVLDRSLWRSADLPRVNIVDGKDYTPGSLDRQLRWYARTEVTYQPDYHSRLIPHEPARCYAPDTPGWIVHTKTRDEQDHDDWREREIARRLSASMNNPR